MLKIKSLFFLPILLVILSSCKKDDNPVTNNSNYNYTWVVVCQYTNFDTSFCNQVFCLGGGEIDSINLTTADSVKIEFDIRTNGGYDNYYMIKNNYDVKDSIVLGNYNDEQWHPIVKYTKISHRLITNFYFTYLLDYLNYYCIKNFKLFVKKS